MEPLLEQRTCSPFYPLYSVRCCEHSSEVQNGTSIWGWVLGTWSVSLVKRLFLLCPPLEGSFIRGSTVHVLCMMLTAWDDDELIAFNATFGLRSFGGTCKLGGRIPPIKLDNTVIVVFPGILCLGIDMAGGFIFCWGTVCVCSGTLLVIVEVVGTVCVCSGTLLVIVEVVGTVCVCSGTLLVIVEVAGTVWAKLIRGKLTNSPPDMFPLGTTGSNAVVTGFDGSGEIVFLWNKKTK